MFRANFVLFVVVGIFISTIATDDHQCPENMEYTTCGSACPPKCNSPPNQFCTLQCVQGCQCKQGFLLSGQNCVTPAQC